MTRPGSFHRDRGAVLPMVMLAVVLLSVIVIGTARYAAANLRYGTVVRDRVVATAAAEAGARYGIDRARNNSLTTCDSGPVELVPTATEPIHPRGGLTITCTRLDAGQPTLAGWAAVVTGEGIGSTTDLLVESASLAPSRDISTGRIMIDTPLQADLQINSEDAFFDGDLFYDGSGDGCATIYEYEADDDVPYDFDDDIEFHEGSFVCWPQRWSDVAVEPPIAALPAYSPSPPAWTTVGSCRVFEPGYYTSLDLQGGADNYFRSGVYLFDDVVITTDNGGFGTTTILAGYPHDVTHQNDLVVGGGCDAAQAADGLDGGVAGVTWYLGGASRIETPTNPDVELLPMLHSDGVREHAVSIHVLGASSVLPSTLTGSDFVIDPAGGGPDRVQIRGQIWAPLQSVDLRFLQANPGGFVTSGVVAARIRFDSTTDTGGWLGTDRTPVEHELLITSIAEFEGQEVEVQAVIRHRPNAPLGARVAVESLDVVD